MPTAKRCQKERNKELKVSAQKREQRKLTFSRQPASENEISDNVSSPADKQTICGL